MVSIIMFVFSFKSKTPLHLSNNSIHRPRAWQFALLNCEVDSSKEEEAGFQHLFFCHFTSVSLPFFVLTGLFGQSTCLIINCQDLVSNCRRDLIQICFFFPDLIRCQTQLKYLLPCSYK